MPRVLTINRNLSKPTGTLAGVTALSRAFRARGWQVDLCGEKPSRSIISATGASVVEVPPSPLLRGYAQRRYLAWRYERISRGGCYDLVIGHGDAQRQDILFLHNLIHRANELVPGGEAGKLGSAGRFHAAILRGRRFRLCLANSGLMRDDIIARFSVPAEMVRVLHPGYDPQRFRPDAAHSARGEMLQRLNLPEGTVLIGLVTSGDLRKRGADILLQAFSRLPAELRSVSGLVIVGKDHTRPYEEQAAALRINEQVLFLEPRTTVEEIYRGLDIMVHPAHIEEFGVIIQEALACGLPVITSRRVGAAELLDPDLVLAAPDGPAITELLSRMIAQPGMRRDWAARGHASIAHNTWEHYTNLFFAYVDALT